MTFLRRNAVTEVYVVAWALVLAIAWMLSR